MFLIYKDPKSAKKLSFSLEFWVFSLSFEFFLEFWGFNSWVYIYFGIFQKLMKNNKEFQNLTVHGYLLCSYHLVYFINDLPCFWRKNTKEIKKFLNYAEIFSFELEFEFFPWVLSFFPLEFFSRWPNWKPALRSTAHATVMQHTKTVSKLARRKTS